MVDLAKAREEASSARENVLRKSAYTYSWDNQVILKLANHVTELANATDGLYEAIKHGDDEHMAWLKKAIDDHFAGRPVDKPRGLGNLERAEAAERRVTKLADEVERLKGESAGSQQLMKAGQRIDKLTARAERLAAVVRAAKRRHEEGGNTKHLIDLDDALAALLPGDIE